MREEQRILTVGVADVVNLLQSEAAGIAAHLDNVRDRLEGREALRRGGRPAVLADADVACLLALELHLENAVDLFPSC